MDAAFYAPLGVSGTIVVIVLKCLQVVWAKLERVEKQMREDQALAWPVLQEATAALRTVLEEDIRRRAIDRERERR